MEKCTDCGTCCFSRSPEYVRVTGHDYERMGELAPSLVGFIGNRAFMKMEEGHCAALRIDANGPAPFTCDIYAVRPDACRDLLEGSPECEGEIATKGDRPKAALDELVALRKKGG
jgi:hypothetical protein